MNWKRRLLKHSVAAITIVVLTILVEILVFNKNAIKHEKYTDTYSEKTADSSGFATRKYGDKRASIIVIDNKYINKMNLEFDSDDNFNYTIELSVINKFGKKAIKKINDKSYSELSRTYLNVGSSASKVKIIYPKEVKLNQITISNEFQYNWIVIVFLLFTGGLIYICIFCKRLVAENIEYAFLITAISLGLVMVISLPENLQSWDEQIHYNRAYMYSYNDKVPYTESAWMLKTLAVPKVDTLEDKLAVQSLLNKYDDKDDKVTEIDKDSNFITYGGRAYILQAFALWIARTCGMKFATGLVMARMFNLFMYVFIMFFAIKLAKHGKRILTIIGLLPTSVFLAASFSYDAYVTAFLTFGFVMIVNEFTDSENPLSWKRILAAVLAITVGSFAKAVYIPLLLMLLFLPKQKFSDKKQSIAFRTGIIIVFLVMMSTFVLPALTNATSGVDSGGDSRGGDTSVTRQLNSVIEHPIEYAELLAGTIIKTAPDYLLGYPSRTFFAYLGGDKGALLYISMILTVFVAFTEGTMENYLPLKRKEKAALAVVIAGIICLIWTALYLDFTPVGLNSIHGVQPRYYIPLMFPIILLIENGRVRCHRVSDFRYNQVVLIGSMIVLSGMIYQYIIVPCCL